MTRALLPTLLLALAALQALAACASKDAGFAYRVRRGDTVYAIGRRFDVPVDTLVRSNRIRNVRTLQVGQELWIPGQASTAAVSSAPRASRTPVRSDRNPTALAAARRTARAEAKQNAKLDFRWPVRGRLSSAFGPRGRRPHEGIDISAKRGTAIVAAESGKVIHAGRLGDYGKVVIVKHSGSYRSIYAHARKLYVRKGEFVERGEKVAEVGTTGNATGPHLHFEIRKRQRPVDPSLYLD